MRFAHRHPLCPSCRYDLVATVKVGGRVCPECGVPFEPHELQREVRPDDWTELRGFRRLVASLAVRSIIALTIWIIWLLGLSLLPFHSAIGATIGIAGCLIVSYAVSRVFWSGLRDHCGFDGPLPPLASLFALIATLVIAAFVIGQVTDLGSSAIGRATLAAATTGLVVILPSAFLDE